MTKGEILNHLLFAAREVSPAIEDILTDSNSDAIRADTCFVDLGINSIDYIEIVTIIMEKLNIAIPINRFACTNNIQEIVDIVWHNTKL